MRLLPPNLVLIFLVVMAALWAIVPGPVVVPRPFNWLGLLPLAGGLALTLAAARRFERARTNINTFGEPTVLVTDGPFRLSRNPIYLGFGILLVGAGLTFGTLSPVLASPIFFVVADRWYVAFEEHAMAQKFGAAYDDYRKTTRRWI